MVVFLVCNPRDGTGGCGFLIEVVPCNPTGLPYQDPENKIWKVKFIPEIGSIRQQSDNSEVETGLFDFLFFTSYSRFTVIGVRLKYSYNKVFV